MLLMASGLTDIGLRRKSNQDAIHLDTEGRYFIVADGMGGHNGGDVASQTALKYAQEYFQKHSKDDPENLSQGAVRFAHQKIQELSKENKELEGMGTTFNGLLFRESKLYISNVGDSRCYLINQKQIYQLSRDHSLIQEKMNLGLQTREQAKKDNQKNIIVRTVGFDEKLEVDLYSYGVLRYDLLLSCSDGLYGKVSDSDILHIINSYIPDPKNLQQDVIDNCVKALVDQANTNGGSDNISVVLIAAL